MELKLKALLQLTSTQVVYQSVSRYLQRMPNTRKHQTLESISGGTRLINIKSKGSYFTIKLWQKITELQITFIYQTTTKKWPIP